MAELIGTVSVKLSIVDNPKTKGQQMFENGRTANISEVMLLKRKH